MRLAPRILLAAMAGPSGCGDDGVASDAAAVDASSSDGGGPSCVWEVEPPRRLEAADPIWRPSLAVSASAVLLIVEETSSGGGLLHLYSAPAGESGQWDIVAPFDDAAIVGSRPRVVADTAGAAIVFDGVGVMGSVLDAAGAPRPAVEVFPARNRVIAARKDGAAIALAALDFSLDDSTGCLASSNLDDCDAVVAARSWDSASDVLSPSTVISDSYGFDDRPTCVGIGPGVYAYSAVSAGAPQIWLWEGAGLLPGPAGAAGRCALLTDALDLVWESAAGVMVTPAAGAMPVEVSGAMLGATATTASAEDHIAVIAGDTLVIVARGRDGEETIPVPGVPLPTVPIALVADGRDFVMAWTTDEAQVGVEVSRVTCSRPQ